MKVLAFCLGNLSSFAMAVCNYSSWLAYFEQPRPTLCLWRGLSSRTPLWHPGAPACQRPRCWASCCVCALDLRAARGPICRIGHSPRQRRRCWASCCVCALDLRAARGPICRIGHSPRQRRRCWASRCVCAATLRPSRGNKKGLPHWTLGLGAGDQGGAALGANASSSFSSTITDHALLVK